MTVGQSWTDYYGAGPHAGGIVISGRASHEIRSVEADGEQAACGERVGVFTA